MTEPAPAGAKRVGFLELFFDLVFVFAVTQLVAALIADHGPAGWGRAAILLWLVWWAWSQYAWAGNAVDLDRRVTRIWVLAAAGTMLTAAVSLPGAFGDGSDGLAFAAPYVAVRLIGLGLYWAGLADDRVHRSALRTYLPVQLASPFLVAVGGVLDDRSRTACWVAAIVVDIVSVVAAGRGEFRIDPAHFAERHGLIVIIALGESVIVTGVKATEIGLDGPVTAVLVVGFVAVAALWWCYFDWVHHAAEARLAGEPDHRRRGHLARDLFTLGHLPIVAGTVVFAAAVKESFLSADSRLEPFGVAALTAGPALYLAGFVVGNLRATGRLLPARTIGLAVLLVVGPVMGTTSGTVVALSAVTGVIVAVALAERHLADARLSP